MKIPLIEEQSCLLKILSPFEHYITGGAVRNTLMGLPVNDIDISVRGYFQDVVDVVSKNFEIVDDKRAFEHGILRVITDDRLTDVCMTRVETFCDGRFAEVNVNNININNDLARRDFTINAIACKVSIDGEVEEVIDPFKGQQDIAKNKLIFLGGASRRIQEDFLRMLRYCRFAALSSNWWYSFADITRVRELAPKILDNKFVSSNRINQEVMKAMTYPHPDAFWEMMKKTDLLMYLFPDLYHTTFCKQNAYHGFESVWDHSIRVLRYVKKQTNDPLVRLAAIFHDIGKPMSVSIDNEGKKHFYEHEDIGWELCRVHLGQYFSMAEVDYIACMVGNHKKDIRPDYTPRRLRKWARLYPDDWRDGAIILSICDYIGHKMWDGKYKIEDIDKCREALADAIEGTILDKKVRQKINGENLLNLGIKQGPRIGEILKYVENRVVDNPELNTREGCMLLALENIFSRAVERENR